jgi:protein involved in polysaccharide export with SLBB domain
MRSNEIEPPKGFEENEAQVWQVRIDMKSGTKNVFMVLWVALVCAQAAKAQDRPLKPGDEVWIVIPGPLAFNDKVKIDENGTVDLGFYGTPVVGGLTLKDAQKHLRKKMQVYLRNTKGVYLKLHKRGRMVMVSGKVVKPGLVAIRSNTDLAEIIQLAGGPARGADLSRVLLIRDGKEQAIDLRGYLNRDSHVKMPKFHPGDTLFVPADPGVPLTRGGRTTFLSNKALDRKVFVLGAVRSPGLFERDAQMDPLTALGLANGPTENADLANARLLTKYDSQRLNLSEKLLGRNVGQMSFPPDGAAILYIPTLSRDKDDRLLSQINVLGGVLRPGRLSVSGPLRLIDAISLAGGPSREADLADVRLVREGVGFTLTTRYDIQNFMENGGLAGRVLVNPGDSVLVDPETSDFWRTSLQVLSDLAILAATVSMFSTIYWQTQGT